MASIVIGKRKTNIDRYQKKKVRKKIVIDLCAYKTD